MFANFTSGNLLRNDNLVFLHCSHASRHMHNINKMRTRKYVGSYATYSIFYIDTLSI